jgi:DNA repair exonuclease SbcCD ATPase subunit
MRNDENVFRLAEKRPASVNMGRLGAALQDYFAKPTLESSFGTRNYNNLFQNLRTEHERMTQYQNKLMSVQKDLGTLNRQTYADTVQSTLKTASGGRPVDLIVPVSKLDPLIAAYEEKVARMTEQLGAANKELLRLASMAELLLDDNNSLRRLLTSRDEETHQILQKISDSTNSSYDAVSQENKFLKQEIENFVAITAQLKEVNKHLETNMKGKEEENARLAELLRGASRDLEGERFKVRHLTEQKETFEPRFYEGRQKLVELEKENLVLKGTSESLRLKYEEAVAKVRKLTVEVDKFSVESQEKETRNFEKTVGLERQVRELKEKIATLQGDLDTKNQLLAQRQAVRESSAKKIPRILDVPQKLTVPGLPVVEIQDLTKQSTAKVVVKPTQPSLAQPFDEQGYQVVYHTPSLRDIPDLKPIARPPPYVPAQTVTYKAVRH